MGPAPARAGRRLRGRARPHDRRGRSGHRERDRRRRGPGRPLAPPARRRRRRDAAGPTRRDRRVRLRGRPRIGRRVPLRRPGGGPGPRSRVGAARPRRGRGLDEVVARAEEPLSRDRERRLGGEWRLGNFVADAYRWKTGADVALQNGGGIREGPPLSGDVTVADLVSVSPFEEPVAVASVTGDELRSVVAEADGRRADGLNDYWYGHVSGMSVAAENGGYVPYVDGEPVDPEERYTVAVPNYILITDLEFPTLTGDHAVEHDDLQYEVVVEYARECGIDAPLEGRIPDAVASE
ncbi:5'-nucleotidase C-terminal domain-containing protein [Halosimplex aquaticum]